jgi:hypothetical protein
MHGTELASSRTPRTQTLGGHVDGYAIRWCAMRESQAEIKSRRVFRTSSPRCFHRASCHSSEGTLTSAISACARGRPLLDDPSGEQQPIITAATDPPGNLERSSSRSMRSKHGWRRRHFRKSRIRTTSTQAVRNGSACGAARWLPTCWRSATSENRVRSPGFA